jgi:hypothetical protein
MCYETYERLLRSRAQRERAATPERDEAKPETHAAPKESAAPDPVRPREQEPA